MSLPMPQMLAQLISLTTLLSLTVTTAGCGGPSGPPTVKVSGRVTFKQTAPPTTGTVYFTPLTVAEGLPRQPGSGTFDAEGQFQVTSYQEHDGLVPGTYSVKVECWKKSSGYTNEREESYVPKSFQAPQLVVPADQEEEVVFDIDVS